MEAVSPQPQGDQTSLDLEDSAHPANLLHINRQTGKLNRAHQKLEVGEIFPQGTRKRGEILGRHFTWIVLEHELGERSHALHTRQLLHGAYLIVRKVEDLETLALLWESGVDLKVLNTVAAQLQGHKLQGKWWFPVQSGSREVAYVRTVLPNDGEDGIHKFLVKH